MSWLDKTLEFVGIKRVVPVDSTGPAKPETPLPKNPRQMSAREKSSIQRGIWEHRIDSLSTTQQNLNKDALEATSGLRTPGPTTVWYDLWLKELTKLVHPQVGETSITPADPELANQATKPMMVTMFDALNILVNEFNTMSSAAAHKVTVSEPKHANPYYRFRISTSSWSLSARGKHGIIEFFHLPASELLNITDNETPSRLSATLCLNMQSSSFWTINGLPLDLHESRVLLRNLFKELILRTAAELEGNTGPRNSPTNYQGDRSNQAMRDLAIEKQNLVQKIVIQQEEIQKRIARDLHDSVISDVMMLKRSLGESAEMEIDGGKILKTLDNIQVKLREICHDLAPRDLIDWGLQPVLEDLVQRTADDTGADCSLNCDCPIPELPESVQLHIYRIIQECLNNTAKYANATCIKVTIKEEYGELTFTIEDNGKGFAESDGENNTENEKEGGFGLGGVRERVDLIRCFYPASITVESELGAGTKTCLKLVIA